MTSDPYHCVANLITGWRQVDLPEELPDARLGGVRATRQQHMKVTYKILEEDGSSEHFKCSVFD